MEKEMMEKVNEILKANGRRELSMDELDKVTGGGLLIGPYNLSTPEDLNSFIDDFCKPIYDMSPDILISVLQEWIPSYGIKREINAFGLAGLYNHLALIMEQDDGEHFH